MTTPLKPVRQGGSYTKDPKSGRTTLINRTEPRTGKQEQPAAQVTTPTIKKHEVSDGTV